MFTKYYNLGIAISLQCLYICICPVLLQVAMEQYTNLIFKLTLFICLDIS